MVMDKTERSVWLALCVIGLVSVALLVSGQFHGAHQSHEPFIKDRVVTVRIVMPGRNWEQLMANPMAKEYVRGDFWYDGRRYPNVAIRAKGNSSLMSVAGTPRMSLKVDFNFFTSAQSFRGLKKLALNNGFADPSFIRESIAYELFDEMRVPAPRTAFVDLWVNDIHLGLYTQVEAIDKAFLGRHFANPNGNLYKPEYGAAELNWTQDDVAESQRFPQSSQQSETQNLNVKMGGSRLSDLLRLLDKEAAASEPSRGAERTSGGPWGQFAAGPDGGFAGGFLGPVPPFPFDPNAVQAAGGVAPWGGFAPPMGQYPPDANAMQAAGGFAPWGRFAPPMGQYPPDANAMQAAGGFAALGGFPGAAGLPGLGGMGGTLLETMGLQTNEEYANYTALFHLLDVLNNTPDESFPEEIENILDVDQVLRYLAVSVMITHLDNYIGMCHNFYLYETNGRFTILPWDLNMAFGGLELGLGGGREPADYPIDQPANLTDRPLMRLLDHQPYLDKYHQYLDEMLEGCFAEAKMEARIDALADQIRPYVAADDLKLFSMDDFEKGLNEGTSSGWWGSADSLGGGLQSHGPLVGMPPQDPNSTGPMGNWEPMGPAGGFGGMTGMSTPGLKSFVVTRRESVRKQLDGKLATRSESQQGRGMGWPMMSGGF